MFRFFSIILTDHPHIYTHFRTTAGKSSGSKASSCTSCAAGSYTEDEGQGSCSDCPGNFYSQAGSSECNFCLKLYYYDDADGECNECPVVRDILVHIYISFQPSINTPLLSSFL